MGLHLVLLPKVSRTPQGLPRIWSGINCRTLVHELGHYPPKTTKELLNITTRLASSTGAVGAMFVQSSAKAAPNIGQGAPTKATDKGA
jgi:hypothetical protein